MWNRVSQHRVSPPGSVRRFFLSNRHSCCSCCCSSLIFINHLHTVSFCSAHGHLPTSHDSSSSTYLLHTVRWTNSPTWTQVSPPLPLGLMGHRSAVCVANTALAFVFSHPSPAELAEMLSELQRVEERLQPFIQRAHSILETATNAEYSNHSVGLTPFRSQFV